MRRKPYRPLPPWRSALGLDGMAELARLKAGDRPSSEVVPAIVFDRSRPMAERRAALDRWKRATHTPRRTA